MIKKAEKSQEGAALVYAVLVLWILFILGTGIVAIAGDNYISSAAERDYQTAYYIAEAGARHAIEYLRRQFEEIYNSGTYSTSGAFFYALNSRILSSSVMMVDFGECTGRRCTAYVMFTDMQQQGEKMVYTLQSKGKAGDAARAVRVKISVSYPESTGEFVPKEALFASNSIEIMNNSHVYGSIGIDSTAKKALRIKNGSTIEGNVYIGAGGNQETVVENRGGYIEGEVMNYDSARSYELPEFPDNLPSRPALEVRNGGFEEIASDGYYQSIRVMNKSTLKFRCDDDLVVRTGNFEVENGSKIVIDGAGSLFLYVDGNVTIKNASMVNYSGSSDKLIIIAGNDIELKNYGVVIKGAIYAPGSEVKMMNGVTVKGTVISANLSVKNACYVYYEEVPLGGDVFSSIGGGWGSAVSEDAFKIIYWKQVN